jgi:Bacterial transglutaminase-like N-terminal region
MRDLAVETSCRHLPSTTYRYRQPVAFGEHRMMLRPRDSHDQRVIEASLEISPEPRSLHFVQDAFGNHVGIARFSGRAKELCFESTVCLEHSPLDATDPDLEDAASPIRGRPAIAMALAALGPADMFKRRARLCGRLGLTPLPKLGANGLVGFEVSGRDK